MYHFAVCLENGWGVRKDVDRVCHPFRLHFKINGVNQKNLMVFGTESIWPIFKSKSTGKQETHRHKSKAKNVYPQWQGNDRQESNVGFSF